MRFLLQDTSHIGLDGGGAVIYQFARRIEDAPVLENAGASLTHTDLSWRFIEGFVARVLFAFTVFWFVVRQRQGMVITSPQTHIRFRAFQPNRAVVPPPVRYVEEGTQYGPPRYDREFDV